MLSLQQLADIAARYDTPPAWAMRAAVAVKAYETGEPVRVDVRRHAFPVMERRPAPSIDRDELRRMMEENRETRAAWRHG